MYSYKLESHPEVKLIDHLRFVGDEAANLIKNKDIKFKYTKEELSFVAKVMGYCHDLGKATKYFQDYIKLDDKEIEFEKDLKSHAFLSAIICYYNLKNYNKELAIFTYLAIKRHHGNLKNFDDSEEIDKIELFKVDVIKKQYKSLDKEIYYICDNFNIKLPDIDEIEDMIDELQDVFENYNDELYDNVEFEKYILIKYLFSILIYCDKEHAIFRNKNKLEYNLPSDLIDQYKLNRFGEPKDDNIREIVYKDVLDSIKVSNNRIMSITLPTGTGKTYTCMSAALKLKNKLNKDMKIIYCLPFTSVIDQNFEDYKNAISYVKNTKEVSSADILKHHYLSPIDYNKEKFYFDGQEGRFLIQNWQSQIVVTTFIQLFNTLFSNKNSDLIKFNNLSDSIILLDEVQSIPYKYWKIINKYLKEIANKMNIYFILITATQPLIFKEEEILELAVKSDFYFNQCKRTKLIIDGEFDKESFFEYVRDIIYENPNKNILIILNTIKLSQELFNEIVDTDDRKYLYLSTSIVPKERRKRISQIKNSDEKCVVVSTQMVEAGVDIDMDIVIRDIAPLDSINQSAGRANRENRGEYLGEVRIVKIKNNNKLIAKSVYKDEILLQATEEALKEKKEILEENYKEIAKKYFLEIDKNKGDKEFKTLQSCIYSLNFETVDQKFKLIEDLDKVQVFIELDDEAEKVWNKYKNYLKIEDKFEKKDKIDSIKVDFYSYVISVFKNNFKENIECGIGYVSKYQLENTYDKNFGYKAKEDDTIIF